MFCTYIYTHIGISKELKKCLYEKAKEKKVCLNSFVNSILFEYLNKQVNIKDKLLDTSTKVKNRIVLNIRIREDVRAKMTEIAESECVSRSKLIRCVLIEYMGWREN